MADGIIMKSTTNTVTEGQIDGIWVICWYLLVVLIGIVAVLGNSLVFYVAYRNKILVRRTALREIEAVIISLAVTDLLIGLIGIPSRVLANWLQDNSKKEEGHFECRYLMMRNTEVFSDKYISFAN